MKTWQVILISFLCGVLTAGVILLIALPPRGQAVPLEPAPTTPPLTIYITGGINQPGVYTLPPDSRLKDAVQAASGASPSADMSAVNLAALLHDGEHLAIPLLGPPTPTDAVGKSSGSPNATPSPAYSAEKPLNINSASQAELENLPGLGPTRASAIVAYRDAHGPFARIEDIQNVPGIGPTTFEHLKTLITAQ
jgi:competence protein ComEA